MDLLVDDNGQHQIQETLSKCLRTEASPYLSRAVIDYVRKVYSSPDIGSITYFIYAA